MTKRIVNYVKKNLSEFKEGDTIYISKIESGFQRIYFCKFLKFERGIIHAKILDEKKFRKLWKRDIITARPTNAFLWGNNSDSLYDHCIWFKKGGKQ